MFASISITAHCGTCFHPIIAPGCTGCRLISTFGNGETATTTTQPLPLQITSSDDTVVWQCLGCSHTQAALCDHCQSTLTIVTTELPAPIESAIFTSSMTQPAPANITDHWPRWVRMIAHYKTDDDIGVGDTIERVLRNRGGDKFKRFMRLIGARCGCDDRQAFLNGWYPYRR